MILGEFELLLINHVREMGPTMPARLHEHLADEWHSSFSTLTITLRRLERKGLLVSTPLKGRSVEYRVNTTTQNYRQMAKKLSTQLVNAFGDCECPDWCNSKLMCSLLAISQGKVINNLSEEDLDALIFQLSNIKKERIEGKVVYTPLNNECQTASKTRS